jgi:RNA polymerase sigma factor (sigma-70 family)
LLRLARARTPTQDDAEDIVHEALLRCVQFAGLDEERLGRFLTSVTIRLCVDEHRRRGQDLRMGWRLGAQPLVVPGADEQVCDRAEARWVAAVVASLPPRQREVLAAKADDMSCGEIGSRYRMSYKAVESALRHGREAVRAALAGTAALVAGLFVRRELRSRSAALVAAPLAASMALGSAPLPGDPGVRPQGPPGPVAEEPVRPVPRNPVVQPPPAPVGPLPRATVTGSPRVLTDRRRPPLLPPPPTVPDPPVPSPEPEFCADQTAIRCVQDLLQGGGPAVFLPRS